MATPERLRLTIRVKAKNLLKDMVALYNNQKQRLGKMQAAVNILSREGCNPENMDQVDNYVAKHLDDFNADVTTYKDDASGKVSDLRDWLGKFKQFCNNEDPSLDESAMNTEGSSYVTVALASVRAPPTSNSGTLSIEYPSGSMESGSSSGAYEEYQESGSSSGASGNGASGNGASGNGASGNGASGNVTIGNIPIGNGASGNGASGNGASGNGASGNGASGNGASGNGASGNGASGNGASGNLKGGRRKRKHSSRKQKKHGRKTRRR